MTGFRPALSVRKMLSTATLAIAMLATACGGETTAASAPTIDLRDPGAASAASESGTTPAGSSVDTEAAPSATPAAGGDTGVVADDRVDAPADAAPAPGPIELPAPADGATIEAIIDDEGLVTITYPDIDATAVEWGGTRFTFSDFSVEAHRPGFSGTRATARATLQLDELIGQRFERYDIDDSEVGAIVTADGERHSRSDIGGYLEADKQGLVEVSWSLYFPGEVPIDPQQMLDGAIIEFGDDVSVPVTIAMDGSVDDSAVIEGLWAVTADVEQAELGFTFEEIQVATALWPAIDNEVVPYRQAPAGTRLLGVRGTVRRGADASRFGENVQSANLVLIVDGQPLDRLDGSVAAPNTIVDDDQPTDAVQWVYEVPAESAELVLEFRSGDEVSRFTINSAVLNDPSASIDLVAG